MYKPIWKTVRLGTCKTSNEYREALKNAGRRVSGWGDDILSRIICSQEEFDLRLVVLSVAELGFRDGAIYADICTRARKFGLELCPAEVGPALGLQYCEDQPNREWLRIAMDGVADPYGELEIFSIEHDESGRWLSGSLGIPTRFWSEGYRFVFCYKR